MKRVLVILMIFLFVFVGSASASEIDLSTMSFEELVELRDQIDKQLQAVYPEYDYILTQGNYFVGVDLPEGTALLCRMNGDDAEYDKVLFYDENKETVGSEATRPKYSRTRCFLEKGQELVLWAGGPIGVKYLQD